MSGLERRLRGLSATRLREMRRGVEKESLRSQPDGALAFALAARPATQVTRSGSVRADAEGRVRYRVRAEGARDGSYQLFVQP